MLPQKRRGNEMWKESSIGRGREWCQFTYFRPLVAHEGRERDALREESCWPHHQKRGFVENFTQFHMKAVIVNMSVVVCLLAPIQLDSHARHKHAEGKEDAGRL